MPKKKPKAIKLRAEADRLWAKAVLLIYGCKCEACEGEEGEEKDIVFQAHHIYPKSSFPALRYEIKNGVVICRNCHFKHHKREDPSIHYKILKKRGWQWWQGLEEIIKKDRNRKIKLHYSSEYYEKQIDKMGKLIKKALKKRK